MPTSNPYTSPDSDESVTVSRDSRLGWGFAVSCLLTFLHASTCFLRLCSRLDRIDRRCDLSRLFACNRSSWRPGLCWGVTDGDTLAGRNCLVYDARVARLLRLWGLQRIRLAMTRSAYTSRVIDAFLPVQRHST